MKFYSFQWRSTICHCVLENEPTANDQEPLDLEDINTKDFQLPKHFDMADVVEAITGPNVSTKKVKYLFVKLTFLIICSLCGVLQNRT